MVIFSYHQKGEAIDQANMATKILQQNWDYLLWRIRHPIAEKLTRFVDGAGNPVVLLHGLGANSYSWRYLAPELGKNFKTFKFDLLGFGDSPKPVNTGYSVYDQAALVIKAIKDGGMSNVSLVGHSYGGGVSLVTAVYFASTEPSLIKSMILIGSIGTRQAVPWFIRLLRVPLFPEKLGYILPPEYNTRAMLNIAMYDRDKITDEMIDAYSRPAHDPAARLATIETAKQVEPIDLDTLVAKYSGINAPSLLVWGQQDKIVPLTVGEKLHTLLPNSKLHIEPECGHLPHEEKPESVVPLIHNFLKDI